MKKRIIVTTGAGIAAMAAFIALSGDVSAASTLVKPHSSFRKQLHSPYPGVMGQVSIINGNTITITSTTGTTTYVVDASNAKINRFGKKNAQVTDIQVGDMVFVHGTVNGASITATSIADGKPKIKPHKTN